MMHNTPLMGSGADAKGGKGRWCVALIGFVMVAAPTFLGIRDIIAIDVASKPGMQQVELAAVWINTTTSQCLSNPHQVVPVFGSQCNESSHYCTNPEGTVMWEPVPQCFLPPPQPFWLEGSSTAIKGFGMGVLFKTSFSAVEPSYKNLWNPKKFELATVLLTVGSTLVSVLLLWHKAWTMPIDNANDAFHCSGIIFSMAPWSANVILYTAKAQAAQGMQRGTRGTDHEKGTEKMDAYYAILCGTFGAFLLLNGHFLFTNLIPTALYYVEVFVPVMALVVLGSRAWHKKGWELVETGEMNEYGEPVMMWYGMTEAGINFIPLLMIPVAILLDLLVQWLASTSVYGRTGLYDLWYGNQGMGYLQAAWTSTSERQSSIYFDNFKGQVLMHAPWAAEWINEVVP